ncbi:357_t:CDS:10 [Ambispora gerdemannii]|uniref:357_t:CDS:1 n=1 Tax=Ambispora gerdemannii TaxID=144530 RepID=A0A9N9D383_9GLOM|nr:357_t:CDS:10 [Ambispora gerdemannii]
MDMSLPPSSSYNGNNNRAGVRFTYGQTRTILSQDFDSLLTDSYSPSKYDDDSEMEIELESKRKSFKSIHELREQGENKRFTDEIEYILDGIREAQPVNVRRASVLVLAQKLLKTEFMTKIRSHHYIPKLYDTLVTQDDTIVRCCFAFVVCLMIEDRRNSEFFAGKAEFTRLVTEFLTFQSDPLREDLSKSSWKKTEKSLIGELKEIICRSDIFSDKKEISLKSIALRSLSSLISYKTKYEDVIKKRIRACDGLSIVARILKDELVPVKKLLLAFEKGKTSKIKQKLLLNFERVEQCLGILENVTAFCPENQLIIVNHEKDILPMLLEFLLYCHLESCDSNAENPSIALECLLGCLRVLINLTHDNQQCCRDVGKSPGMVILMRLATVGQLPSRQSINYNKINTEKEEGIEESVEATKFDVLLLSIGLLINLVEIDSGNQDEFRKIEQNPNCPGTRSCLRLCTCSSRKSAVSCLVSLYNHQIEKGDDKTDSNIVAAYMAILIGLLIKDNKANQELRLPGNSVQSLINLLQDFVKFHELVGGEASTIGNSGQNSVDLDAFLDDDDNHHSSGGITGVAASGGGNVMLQRSPQNQQQQSNGRNIGDSFLEIVDSLKAFEQKRLGGVSNS